MNVIGPFPLYAILNPIYSQILHVRSIWNSFKIFTVSLTAEEFANGTLKLILSKFSVFTTQTVPNPTIDLSIHPRSNTIFTFQYVGDTCQANEKGQGHVHPKSSGEQFFTVTINTPSPLPHFLYSAWPLSLSLARASQTLAPPLLHRHRWGRASLPRPRRRRTRADRRNLHSAAAVAVFLRQVRAWKIWTDELQIYTSQFVVFFIRVIKSYFYCPLWFKLSQQYLQRCFILQILTHKTPH